MSNTITHDHALSDDALDTLFREARTANTFTDEPVPLATLQAVHDLLKWGPTAANSQPLRIVFLTTEEAKGRLLPLMSAGNRAKTAAAPAVAILAADTDFHQTLPKVFPHNPGAKDWFGDPGKRARAAEFNAALQIGYFIVAARAAGLAVGPMNGFDRAGVDREFFSEEPLTALVVANLGKPGPDAWAERLPRHSFDEAVRVL